MRHTLACIQLAHRRDFQLAGILLSGHIHCSPPFNVNCPLISCLTFGVQSTGNARFPRAVGREENLLLVFLAFHGPAFSTARRPPRFVFCKKHRSSLSSCGLEARVPIRTSTAVLPPPDRTRVQTEGVRRASWYPS